MDFESKFTKSEVLTSMTPNDSTACMIGYVDRVDSNPDSPGNKFYKVILSNGDGKRVQVVAWQENILKLSSLNLSGKMVLHVKNATVLVPKQTKYNHGNVPFELQVGSHTTLKMLGDYKPENSNAVISKVELSKVTEHIGSRIIVKGHIKNTFGHYATNSRSYYIAGLADIDNFNKLELNSIEDLTGLFEKGQYVQVIGIVETHAPCPTVLRVENAADITVVDAVPRCNFLKLIPCYNSI